MSKNGTGKRDTKRYLHELPLFAEMVKSGSITLASDIQHSSYASRTVHEYLGDFFVIAG